MRCIKNNLLKYMKIFGGNNRAGESGFTLIEILVAVVILSVGLLGMAAMTIIIIRGNRMAVRQTNATNLAQQLMERLKDVDFNTLGTAAGQNPVDVGYTSVVSFDAQIDEQGNSPGVFNRLLKVCDSTSPDQTGTEDLTDSCSTDDIVIGTVGTADLICRGNLNLGEKQLRIVVSWYEDGRCRDVAMETVVVNSL
jgi:prepilin-type N-terminal cleavage/methylation domain-containing protein